MTKGEIVIVIVCKMPGCLSAFSNCLLETFLEANDVGMILTGRTFDSATKLTRLGPRSLKPSSETRPVQKSKVGPKNISWAQAWKSRTIIQQNKKQNTKIASPKHHQTEKPIVKITLSWLSFMKIKSWPSDPSGNIWGRGRQCEGSSSRMMSISSFNLSGSWTSSESFNTMKSQPTPLEALQSSRRIKFNHLPKVMDQWIINIH